MSYSASRDGKGPIESGERGWGIRAITIDASRPSRALARFVIATLVLGCAALGARTALAQDDDWSVVSHQVRESPASHAEPAQSEPAAPQAGGQTPDALPQELQP